MTPNNPNQHGSLSQTHLTPIVTKREYESVRITAELFQHPDIYEATLRNRDSKGKISLENAFREKETR